MIQAKIKAGSKSQIFRSRLGVASKKSDSHHFRRRLICIHFFFCYDCLEIHRLQPHKKSVGIFSLSCVGHPSRAMILNRGS